MHVLFLSSFILSTLQLRFTDILAISSAILSSYTICMVLERLEFPVFAKKESEDGKKRRKKKRDKKEVRKGDWIAVMFFITFLLSPSFIVSLRPLDISEEWTEALLWIKNNTQPTSNYLHPEVKAEYSVMSWWDYGNWIVYLAKRPVVCNNFQAGAIDAAKFFTAQNESDALKIARKRGVKYVITDDDMGLHNESGKFIAIMKIAGLKPQLMNKTEIINFYNRSMYYKLHIEGAENLTRFLLIRDFGRVKIFEVQ